MKSSRKLAILAVFTALSAVFYMIPFVFLLPVIVAALLFDGWTALWLSFFVGVVGLGYSFLGTTPISIAFRTYPWVSIVPRLFIGPGVFGIRVALQKLFSNSKNRFLKNILPYSAAAIAGSLINTVLVLGSFALFYSDAVFGEVTMLAAIAEAMIMGAIEAGSVLVLAPLLYHPLIKLVKQTGLKNCLFPAEVATAKNDSSI